MLYFNQLCLGINNLDEDILLLVNGNHTPFLDQVMLFVSDRLMWIPLYFMLLIILYRKTGFKKGVFVCILIAALITATDQTCASILRPLIGRLRPSNPDNTISDFIVLVNDYRGGRYGFPSCHAANTMALAIFLSLLLKNRYATIGLIVWSLLVSYSRIYLGVHYPSDILGGLIIGTLFALIYYQPVKWYDRIIRTHTDPMES